MIRRVSVRERERERVMDGGIELRKWKRVGVIIVNDVRGFEVERTKKPPPWIWFASLAFFQAWKLCVYIYIYRHEIQVCIVREGERKMQCKYEEARKRVRFGWLWSKPITFPQRFLSGGLVCKPGTPHNLRFSPSFFPPNFYLFFFPHSLVHFVSTTIFASN